MRKLLFATGFIYFGVMMVQDLPRHIANNVPTKNIPYTGDPMLVSSPIELSAIEMILTYHPAVQDPLAVRYGTVVPYHHLFLPSLHYPELGLN